VLVIVSTLGGDTFRQKSLADGSANYVVKVKADLLRSFEYVSEAAHLLMEHELNVILFISHLIDAL
jgi:hypothetical protein